MARSHGSSLEGLHLFEMQEVAPQLSEEAEHAVRTLRGRAARDMQRLLGEIEQKGQPRGVRFAVRAAPAGTAPLRYRRQILMLKQFFVGRQCTVLFLDDRTAPEDDRQLQSIAHGVVLLEQHASDYGNKRRRLRVVEGSRPPAARRLSRAERLSGAGCGSSRVWWRPTSRPSSTRRSLPAASPLWTRCSVAASTGGRPLDIGPAGSGKSTLALRYALSAAAARRARRAVRLRRADQTLDLRARGLGLDLEGAVGNGRLLIKQIDPAEMGPGEFVASVNAAALEDRTRVIIIDSLNGYLKRDAGGAGARRCSCTSCSRSWDSGGLDLPVDGSARDPGPGDGEPDRCQLLADTVIMLRYFEADGAIRKAISVRQEAQRHARGDDPRIPDGSASTASASGNP